MRYALLLRAVNVGGTGRLAMADFRGVLQRLGHADVATYLQSGNATLASDLPAGELAEQVEAALAAELGLATTVLVRTGDELAAVVAGNPFPEEAAQPSRLLVTFLREPLAADLDHAAWLPDRFAVMGREVYQHYAEGMGRSRMAAGLLRGTGAVGTSRNWTTLLALAGRTAGS